MAHRVTLRRYRTVQTATTQLLQNTSIDVVELLRVDHVERVRREGYRIIDTDEPVRAPVWFVETDDGLDESWLPQDRDPDAYRYTFTSTVVAAD